MEASVGRLPPKSSRATTKTQISARVVRLITVRCDGAVLARSYARQGREDSSGVFRFPYGKSGLFFTCAIASSHSVREFMPSPKAISIMRLARAFRITDALKDRPTCRRRSSDEPKRHQRPCRSSLFCDVDTHLRKQRFYRHNAPWRSREHDRSLGHLFSPDYA